MKIPDRLTNAINGGLLRITTARDNALDGSDVDSRDAIVEISINGVSRKLFKLANGAVSALVAHIHPHGDEWAVDLEGQSSLAFKTQELADNCFHGLCEDLLIAG